MSAAVDSLPGGLEKGAELIERAAKVLPGQAGAYVGAGARALRAIAAVVGARKKTLEQVLAEIERDPPPDEIDNSRLESLIEENRRIERQEKG